MRRMNYLGIWTKITRLFFIKVFRSLYFIVGAKPQGFHALVSKH